MVSPGQSVGVHSWVPSPLKDSEHRERHWGGLEGLARLSLAASPPHREGKKDANSSPKERRGELGRSRCEGKVISWMMYHASEKTGYCQGISYQGSLSPQSPEQEEIVSKWSKHGSGHCLLFPGLEISSPTFFTFQGPQDTSFRSPTQVPQAGPIPPLSGAPPSTLFILLV